jgi:FAD/FMN-containing dehydrogenase
VLEIIRPDSRQYAAVRHVYGAAGSPAIVLRPTSTEEVAEALAVYGDIGGELSIRSGGHGISSIATNTGGTVIDLSRLSAIDRTGDTTVRIGPGAHWGHVARQLTPWGLAISSGDSGDVGVGGLATTGGIGLMGRAHGLTIDHITGVDIVTAGGAIHRASTTENPDLFWGVRGAGANLGIVTSFDFDAAPVGNVAQATIGYQLGDATEFLRLWGDAVENAPREISAFLYLFGGDNPFGQTTVVYAGDDADAATSALTSFLQLPGVAGQRAALVPYAAVPMTTDAPHTGQQSAFTHTGLADHLDQDLATRLAALLAEGSTQMLQIRSVGGAINDVPADATAYAHRHQNFSVTAIAASASARFDAAWHPAHERMTGMYLSFESGRDPGRVLEAFPAETLARLRKLKVAWDPTGLFRQNFDVSEPTAKEGRRA